MESSSYRFLKIEKLAGSNFHIWKKKVQFSLVFRELEDHRLYIEIPFESTKISIYNKIDAKSREVIGFTINNGHLNQVHDVKTFAEMRNTIIDVFQGKKLLNSLNARRRLYSEKMTDN